MEVVFGERKMKNLNKWLGRTAYQLMPDRFFNVGGLPGVIGKNPNGRILKDWNDRMPNWQPNEKGEYTNDYYYGGNLKGIIAKLDYLKELGFDMIYITPIELSESYHHYNPSEQEKIDNVDTYVINNNLQYLYLGDFDIYTFIVPGGIEPSNIP